MAYPYNIGQLFPSEGAFRRPGAYRDFMESQATQRSAYLSDMDRFYEQLTETVREFDATLGYKQDVLETEYLMHTESLDWAKEALEMQIDWQKEQHGDQMELGWDELRVREKAADASAAYNRAMLEINRTQVANQGRYQQGMLGLEQDKLALSQKQAEESAARQESMYEDILAGRQEEAARADETMRYMVDQLSKTSATTTPRSGEVTPSVGGTTAPSGTATTDWEMAQGGYRRDPTIDVGASWY